MAKLILTEEEKEAQSFLDWDDASLGKFVKNGAVRMKEEADGSKKPIYVSAILVLLGLMKDSDATELTEEVKGFTYKGESVGDFTLTIKQKNI